MKHRITKISLIISMVAITLSGLCTTGFAGEVDTYYKNNPMSVEELKAKWGEPASIVKMDKGVKKMIFEPKNPYLGYYYYLTQNGQVTGQGFCDTLVPKTNTLPDPQSLMTTYYKKHPMAVETLKEKRGEPISSRDYDNGITKLTFGPKVSYIGYTYFLIYDGQVIGESITGD